MEWTFLDFSTYLIQNSATVVIMVVLGLCISVAISGMMTDFGTLKFKPVMRVLTLVVFLTVPPVTLLPTHGRVLAVKIERIKNEAVNKANIEKGIDHFSRIAEKLECKYLGCNKEN